jgi:hypothetical protein
LIPKAGIGITEDVYRLRKNNHRQLQQLKDENEQQSMDPTQTLVIEPSQ